MRVHLVEQGERCACFAVQCPSGFVELMHSYVAIALSCADACDLLGKLAHHVAARNPHRQAESLVRHGFGHRQEDASQAGLW